MDRDSALLNEQWCIEIGSEYRKSPFGEKMSKCCKLAAISIRPNVNVNILRFYKVKLTRLTTVK